YLCTNKCPNYKDVKEMERRNLKEVKDGKQKYERVRKRQTETPLDICRHQWSISFAGKPKA
ncbi:hypothetical protein L9F63_016762, partial [Diploptera punctata]